MRAILDTLRAWLASGEQIALATVVGAEGSSPRPLGSRMAVTASGQMAGSVSGGCVEGDVFREAQSVLASGTPKLIHYGVTDETGWEVGLACGGAIDVYVEPLADVHRRLAESLAAEETVALLTPLDEHSGGRLLIWPDGRLEGNQTLTGVWEEIGGAATFSHPVAESRARPEGEGSIFIEIFAPPETITIVGAVHIAAPLVELAHTLGFRVRLVDARRTFAARERFPTVDDLVIAWPQEALAADRLGPQDYVVILTHDPKFDVPALEIALRSRAGYVGLIGSRGTQAKRQAALRKRGFKQADLDHIHGPVGLDLGGRTPAEIALAILAEIVAVRNGRSGGKMSER
jgi:xanthine dehydrogenase accessory factor